MDKLHLHKKAFAILLIAIGAGGLVGFLVVAPLAHADLLGTLWNDLFPKSATTTQRIMPAASNTTTPLYKPVVDYEQAVVQAVRKASPAVVSIVISKNVPIIENCPTAPFSNLPPDFQQFFGNDFPQFNQQCQRGSQLQEVGGGSGFIIDPSGLILTNRHVVADTKASYTVLTNDGKKYDAKVLARDPAQDLAVLKIDAKNLPVVELGNSDSIDLGQSAIAIGNALGEFRNTVSVGVISGLARTVTASGGDTTETIQGVIQTDAAINPGNSGGPLLNLQGQVIAINTAIASDAQNIGFAIPINRAKRDIDSVRANGEINFPFLGVRTIMVTPDLAKQKNLSIDHGALVAGSSQGPGIIAGSPAAQAGVQEEDIILEVNGRAIDKDHDLPTSISQFNVGDIVHLKIYRKDKDITINATLAKRPQS